MTKLAAQRIATKAVGEARVRDVLPELLCKLADCEALFTERFYPILFALRPDVRPLFGVHPMAEQEEMMRETLRSLHGWLDGEPWLAGNLEALGRSHWEYGVTDDMYDSFIDAMLACSLETISDAFDDERQTVFRAALHVALEPMRAAGNEAAAVRERHDREAKDPG